MVLIRIGALQSSSNLGDKMSREQSFIADHSRDFECSDGWCGAEVHLKAELKEEEHLPPHLLKPFKKKHCQREVITEHSFRGSHVMTTVQI